MRRLLVAGLLISLAACGAPSTDSDGGSGDPGPGGGSGGSGSVSLPTTTAAPTSPMAARAVTIPTADGATLSGRVYGSGPTAVVLSNMGDNNPAPWDGFAALLAGRGYTVLTYAYRYPTPSRTFTAAMAGDTVTDLRAAVDFVRGAGATRVALVGASLGGMATAKLAGSVGATAMVLVANPADLPDYDFHVTDQELAALTMPKLVIASTGDTTVPAAATRALYDRAPEPKQFHEYPSPAHGVGLFSTEHAADLRQRLTDFVVANAAAS